MRICRECGAQNESVFAGLYQSCLDRKVRGGAVELDVKHLGQGIVEPSALVRLPEQEPSSRPVFEPRTLGQKVLKKLGRWP